MAKPKRIIVIGGSAAGPKSAARARRLDQNAEIIIIQKDSDLSMASCGYSYYVGGVFVLPGVKNNIPDTQDKQSENLSPKESPYPRDFHQGV